jgi:hypothetical protein
MTDRIYLFLFIYAFTVMGVFGILIPLLDEYVFNFAYKTMMCEHGFYLPTNSTKIWCGIK